MKEVTSILENDHFEVFVHHLSKTLTLFDKHCSCVLLNTEDTNNNRRLYQVFAELLDDQYRLDQAFAELFTKENDMLINAGGFYVLNEEYGRWSEVYEDKGCDSREAFESMFELIGMILSDYSNVMEEQWCDELVE